MVRYPLLILIIISLLTLSCSSRRAKLDRRNLIPEKELVSILTDTYLTDGLLGVPRIVLRFSPVDSITTYSHIIEQHGYTMAIMDKTMKYYFIKNPKKLIKIYDKVLGILSEMESRNEKAISKVKKSTTYLWPGKDFYSFPDPQGSDSADFDITLKSPGTYTLSFTVILFPDDQSLKPGLSGYSCHPDSLDTGKRTYLKTLNYFKDGRPHNYSTTITVPLKNGLHIKGSLFDFNNNPENMEKHVLILDISLIHFAAV